MTYAMFKTRKRGLNVIKKKRICEVAKKINIILRTKIEYGRLNSLIIKYIYCEVNE